MKDVFLGIGSNLGIKKANISKALSCLNNLDEIKIKKVSKIIVSEPVGGPKQGEYLNAVIEIETTYSPECLLQKLKAIEQFMGRVKTVPNGPRIIDLDILLYSDVKVDKSDLIIPHPRMMEREFVLEPLKEIAPEIFNRLKENRL